MISLEDALSIRNIVLDAEASDIAAAIDKAISLLQHDPQMLDWDAFSQAVNEREKKSGTSIGGGLLLPHGRGDFVKNLVMSFVRLRTPIEHLGEKISYLIAVAVPSSMAADYLRLVGAIARVFRDPEARAGLGELNTARELLDWLTVRCR